ncbi:unnamed protein product, partial [Brassica napus]
HFKLLLASTDPEVLIAALETLSALVKISSSKLHRSGKLIGCGSVNSFLLSIAQGWGSKEEGLGLYSCVVANERNQEEGLTIFPSDLDNNHKEADFRIGSTVYFELRGHSAQSIHHGTSSASSSSSRVIQIPDLHLRKEDDLVLLKECIEHYNVPPDLRFSLLTRVRYAHAFRSSRICRSYSRICLLAFIVLVQSSDAQEELASFFANEPEYTNELIRIVRSEEPIPGTIRTLAMLALGAQLAVYSASHDRARILSRSSISFAVGNRMILLNVLQKAVLSLKISSDPSSIAFVEALLQFYLLHIVSSSSSGSTIRGSGMVPTFLPLLEYTDPSHLHLVYLAVKALQKLMDYSSSAVPLLRDLGGVELLSQRLELEVHHILKLTGENNSDMVVGESLDINGDQLLSRKRLIKVLLKSLGSSTYTPGNANRSQSSQESTLPATLSLIYRNADKFGGDIYYSAVTVMSDLIHKDPTSLTSLFEMGLPEAFLSSVVSGVLPSSKAIACIPNGLGAISLNSKGLETVKETSALRFLVDVFTSKKYVLAMNEAIVPFTNAVEELLRHVSSLRATGVEIIIEIVDRIACFGESGSSSSSVSTAMEMDSDVKNINGVSHEQFVQLCIFHLIILLHRTMENAETSRLFVEKSGIVALLKLLLRPGIAQSSEGVSIALHSTIVFKSFTQHHSASLARAFCSSLRDQVKKALGGLQDLSGTFLLDRKLSPSCGIFSSLFLVEFLLFLAASKDNRWMTALLSEFANGSKDVLENIGQLHREILWHIAVYESGTLESPNTSPESEQTELSSNGTEGQRFSSFRQFLDPLFQRRTSGWSAESQFFDLTNLYRDLGRASTGFQPRPISDGPSSSSDASGNRELERDGSYYTSCCDMVKSLSFHITYIFQELGKAMLLQSRRREDTVNVSPSSKLVASSFASISLDHLNFEGHEIAAEASRSTKCLYLGKVVDFIDAVLLDRPDSCNPVLINCFYGRGVIQTVLTTFDATSQLLFSINRSYSSPMETDDVKGKQDEKEDTDHAWIYGPLASYGKLMDHLATSSFILSPFTKRLLVQPVENGNIPFPQNAETFVKILQSIVLKAVLPVWTHPLFTECSYDFVTALISIIKHVYSGVELKSLAGSSSARVTGPPPSETTISTIVEMGFSRSRAEEALRQVGSNSVELAMEWLFSHPEEIQEDDELARALAMSLGNSESDTKENVVDETREQIEAEIVSLPPVEELITTCTKLLQMKEPLAFPVRDLLVLICSENNGEHRSGGICCLLNRIKDCCPVFDDTKNNLLSALLHVLALILHEDAGSREVALKAGTVRLVCDVLSKWDSGSIDKEKFNVPKWVTTGFLAIDRLLQVDQKLNTELIEELQKKAISQGMSASLAKIVFILKLLSEMLLMYSSSIHIILRRDAEIKSLRGPQQKGGQVGGIFHHILRKFIPYSRVMKEKKSESDWRQKLTSRANQFLVGASVRSAEARKRIFSDISSIFNDFIGTSNGLRPPVNEIHVLIVLLNDMLSARSPTGSHISSEASNTFVDVGLVKSLTRTLEVLDMDNVESTKTVTGIIKVLELVTKEHAYSADSNSKNETANNSSDQIQSGRGDTTADASEAGEIMLRSNHDSMTADHAENFGGSEDVTDDMEHDQDLDEGFAAGVDDYMQEEPEDARGLENGIGSMGIEFEMHTHVPENLDEEDEEDEDDEDRQGQAPEPSSNEQQNSGDIDPEFLAALPADIRAEVLAQQQAQRVHQSHELEGVPPLVSRRVLETLTYLARNHIYVAKILLQSRLSLPSLQGSVPSDKARGKAVVVSDDHMSRTQQEPESVAFALLLSLLNQPLYLRSVAHLEQLLNLLEVIIDNAERKSESADGSDGPATEQQSTHQALEVENNSENHDMVSGTAGTVTKPIVSSGSSSNRAESECDVHTVLLNLPQSELCLLCSLLAREGLSDNAYTLVAEVLKKLVAIAPSHCHLFITELANAIQNLTRSAISELHMFGEAVKTLLSTTSSDGSGVLRVLQALSSLVDSLLITKEKNSEEHVAVFSQLSNINLALEPLWLELSNCICKIEGHSDSASASASTTSPTASTSSATTRGAGVSQSLPAGAQNMLPYVESFFVTCEKLHPSSQSCDISVPMAASDVEEQPKGPGPSSSSKVDEKYGSFIKFSERHRKLLNAFIRQNPALLEKSFSLMLKVPRFIEFDNKRAYFRSKIKHQHDHHHSPLRISVRRAYILEDSYNQLRMRSTQELKGRLTVHFQGEEGIDAGGLTREWYQLLSRVIFDKGALLFTTVGNDSTFQPNPNSVYQTEHLSYFKFVGRVVGKALFDGQLLDVHFTRSFYKHILGVKVTYHDIEAIDPDYYKALKWMLENDISDVLDLTFSVDADEEKLILYEKTEVTDHELIPGGRNIKVTEENKHEYVDLIAEHRLTTAIRPQINAFLEGFSELILKDLISIFNDKELELLISGLPDIDLDNLRANTEYSGYSPGSPVIQWFWEVVQGLSKEDKARLLQFVTGTSKVPLEGFSSLQGISGAQKFQIHKAYGSADHLPSAHTCFNQLDLPEYPSKEHLQERLLLAIHEASEGFGFG